MEKNHIIILILLILIFLFILADKQGVLQSKGVSKQKVLSEFQIEACNSADIAKTCDTRLPEVGVVLKEDCCEALGKCC